MSPELNFNPIIRQWFKQNFKAASPPQKMGWPSIASGQNTLICAPTGSGKTLAAFLWCINDLFIKKSDSSSLNSGIHTLYISPLKALNNDIQRNLEQPLQGIRQLQDEKNLTDVLITSLVRTGDTSAKVRSKMLKTPPDILITTPESLYLLLTSEKGRLLFSGLSYIIIDEIHALCSNKRGVHLSLSLERLMPLCKKDPVRIGLSATQNPLQRVADYLGGQTVSSLGNKTAHFKKRAVKIIDTGQRKHLDLKVISAVEKYSELPEASVWPEVYQLLYKLIREHKTTLIFVTMRSQTEKIARALNTLHQQKTGNHTASIALAHHGSLSREIRFAIESKLKEATIPAVVATGSLELGIDIGSIDLVIQLESPKTVSGALQRVGRSGHLVSASSKGRIIPLYRADIDDCITLTDSMLKGAIEETKIPENALDVLAQHITAEVAMKDWDNDAMFNLVRQSYCYRNLSANAYGQVIDMLTGKIKETALRALQPRLNYDTINNKLITRKASRLLAVMNGGTIPDRAYYAVYLNEGKTKLGEMDEEFVFESRVGQIFYLGNSEYRINDIKQDRIIVSLQNESKPRAPFWKGDLLYRDAKTHKEIGRFRADLQKQITKKTAKSWIEKNYPVDSHIAENLLELFERQLEHAGAVPTDQKIILENFIDINGEPMLLFQAPFGARVNGLWVIIIAGLLEDKHGIQVQYVYDDDAFLIRLLDTTESPDFMPLLTVSNDHLEKLLLERIIDSTMFTIYFRYNAARALMLPRSQPGNRIPLWLQRLRAADLLQAVRQIPDFPIITETYREVLYDVFDWPALQQILAQINQGDISIHAVTQNKPSPLASGLLFRMVFENMYDYDRSRQTNKGSINFNELLDDILKREKIPQVVSQETNRLFSQKIQHLYPGYQARDKEELFSLIENLGPIDTPDLELRCTQNALSGFEELKKDQRIIFIEKPLRGWITKQSDLQNTVSWTNPLLEKQLYKIMQFNGVLSLQEINHYIPVSKKVLESLLKQLLNDEKVINGPLIRDDKQVYWCEKYNFLRMYRQSIALQRHYANPATFEDVQQFMFAWHFITEPVATTEQLVERYQGCTLPIGFFKQSILTSRFLPAIENANFDALVQNGQLFFIINKTSARHITEIILQRTSGNYFEFNLHNHSSSNDDTTMVLNFLKENGASFFSDIQDATGLTAAKIQKTISHLVQAGSITCDNYDALYALSSRKTSSKSVVQSSRHRIRLRSKTIQEFNQRDVLRSGRWFKTNSFSIAGKKRSLSEMADFQAKMLLQRYGLVVKEWYRQESGLLPWILIFNALKKLEWQGEIRRGYFFQGLSGLQFALPEALNLLEKIQAADFEPEDTAVFISCIDPALPYGASVSWNIKDKKGHDLKIQRKPGNYLFLKKGQITAYTENNKSRIYFTSAWKDNYWDTFVNEIKKWFKGSKPPLIRKIEILEIDKKPAAGHSHKDIFISNGFESEQNKLVLWPSGL